jgi:type IV pilus assembly protein PilV
MMRRSHNSGFTLIEIMIALFVLGIGLLGVAGLQSVSTSMNQQSELRTYATHLADDMADRMRANPRGVDQGEYNMAGAGVSPTQSSNCEAAPGCNSAALAGHDLSEWTQTVSDVLPEPPAAGNPSDQAFVCRDSASPGDGTVGSPSCDGGDQYVIKIWWFDKEGQTAAGQPRGDVQRFVTEFQP